jgi:hypothetical protein
MARGMGPGPWVETQVLEKFLKVWHLFVSVSGLCCLTWWSWVHPFFLKIT